MSLALQNEISHFESLQFFFLNKFEIFEINKTMCFRFLEGEVLSKNSFVIQNINKIEMKQK